ncbi:GerAB/ArcD/ProY family transporter [bacterium]|nr:GerAB/ArcD/ProY family transporter [bacterium]
MNKFFRATAVLIGTIVGAGIFALPYAFEKSGFWVGVIYLIIFTAVMIIVSLCYGETILRTKENLQMAGYAKKYLGKTGKITITLSLILGTYGALTAYTIGVGRFLWLIFNPHFGGSPFVYSLIFWFIASLIVFTGVKTISHLEIFMVFALVAIVFLIAYFGVGNINWEHINKINFKNIFFPYGVTLFALGGASALPMARQILRSKIKHLKKAIILGGVLPTIIYFIFALTVVGLCGEKTTETALTGLVKVMPKDVLTISSIFGILTMTTSFLTLGYILMDLFIKDYKIKKIYSWLLAVFIPLILFLSGVRSFVQVIALSGGILTGLQGIILIMTYYRAKKYGNRQPEYSFKLPKFFAYIIYLIFIVGIFYQIFYH